MTLLHGKNLLLKLIEDSATQQLLSRKEVQDFLATDDLCYKGFREPVNRILELEKRNTMEMEREILYLRRDVYYFLRSPRATRISAKELPQPVVPKRVATLYRRQLAGSIKRLQKVDRSLLENEEKVRSFNKDAEVLYPTVLLRCPKCGMPLFKEKTSKEHLPRRRYPPGFDIEILRGEVKGPAHCATCGTKFDRESALRTNLHAVKETIREVWEKNLWLEDYVSKLLQSMEWKTWSHVHVLGSSGVRHEVDVLGVKMTKFGSYVLVCECKTGRVSRQEVFNFWAKVYDIKSHVSMLALIEQLPEPETREFVTKNPSVLLLENMGEKRKSEITKELGNGILGRI